MGPTTPRLGQGARMQGPPCGLNCATNVRPGTQGCSYPGRTQRLPKGTPRPYPAGKDCCGRAPRMPSCAPASGRPR